MMSLYRNLLFFLIASSLLQSHHFPHAASTSSPITRPGIIFMTGMGSEDDYRDYYNEDNNRSFSEVPSSRISVVYSEPQLCKVNPCLENQEPCEQLSEQSGCLCPGISGADEPPHPPVIQTLLPVNEGDNSGKVEVQWCAPSSVVSGYRVVVEGGKGEAFEFGNALRRGLVGSLEVGTRVCVEAVNSAGHSSHSDFACSRYDPPKTAEHKLLLWIIVGGVALLLLIIITAVILWKQKICQKGKRDSTDGLGNPSYSTEGTL